MLLRHRPLGEQDDDHEPNDDWHRASRTPKQTRRKPVSPLSVLWTNALPRLVGHHFDDQAAEMNACGVPQPTSYAK